ncbi:hypothetical protein QFC20_006274 [Naganishia adeliensis]|uniref:Uncharacterized protein n=1 Tax=Naganishia adeliensis TaxID=92952 RepID=A0ACC2VD79_9TREE|nr:hypothetical protein QFC20_006274 [Naganishia adeliensis]
MEEEEEQSGGVDESTEEEDPALNFLVPMICMLCLEEKKDVEWDIALAICTGKTEEEHHARVVKVLGYEWTGEQDDRYREATEDIFDPRGEDKTANTNMRCGILRLTLRDMIRHWKLAHGVKEASLQCMVPKRNTEKCCKKREGFINLGK